MQSTAPATVRETRIPLHIAPRSLAAAFTRVPDPRRAASVVYPLAAILALVVTAILANRMRQDSAHRPAAAVWPGMLHRYIDRRKRRSSPALPDVRLDGYVRTTPAYRPWLPHLPLHRRSLPLQ